MNHDTSPQLEGCTVQRKDGRFCDSPSADEMPFPICAHHATKLFMHMRWMVKDFDNDPLRKMMVAIDGLDTERSRAARNAPKRRPGVVYYVLVGDVLKIGYSENLRARLNTYPPHRKLLATEPGTYSLEAKRHNEFADLLNGGREWFRFEGALVEHVQRLREAAA